eukprot:PLAT1314.1.p1 GENE.PLAT1314.1~~PLAT1314.1.p1  ORF type:complete len:383 (+),score=210.17 PLAT1314.1:41-1150(+)
MELWLATLRNAPEYTPELHDMWPALPAYLQQDADYAKEVILLLESYILLGGDMFLSAYPDCFNDLLAQLDSDSGLRTREVILLARVLDLVLTLYADRGVEALQDCLLCMLRKLMADSVAREEAAAAAAGGGGRGRARRQRGRRGGRRDARLLDTLARISYLSLFARSMLHWPDGTMELLAVAEEGVSPSQLLRFLLDAWLAEIDAVGHTAAGPARRKLWAMALASLLPTEDGDIHASVPAIVSQVYESMVELERWDPAEWYSSSSAESSASALLARRGLLPGSEHPKGAEDEVGEAESARKRQLCAADPVYVVDLRTFLFDKFEELRVAVGDDVHAQLLAAVDEVVMAELYEPGSTAGDADIHVREDID